MALYLELESHVIRYACYVDIADLLWSFVGISLQHEVISLLV